MRAAAFWKEGVYVQSAGTGRRSKLTPLAVLADDLSSAFADVPANAVDRLISAIKSHSTSDGRWTFKADCGRSDRISQPAALTETCPR